MSEEKIPDYPNVQAEPVTVNKCIDRIIASAFDVWMQSKKDPYNVDTQGLVLAVESLQTQMVKDAIGRWQAIKEPTP